MPPSREKRRAYSRPLSQLEQSYYAQVVGQLVDARIKRGWTQEQLDYRLQVTEGQVAKWESLTRLPGAFLLMCWADALNLKLTVQRRGRTK